MATNTTKTTTTHNTTSTRDTRTYLDPVWYDERDIWTADTIEELRDRLKHQEAHTRLEAPWELVTIRKSRKGGLPAAIVVKRDVYCDPPWLDPMLKSFYRKFGPTT
jgi:hypothetical protein